MSSTAGYDPRTLSNNRQDFVTTTSPDVINVGVIGYGYWGPNIVRNLNALENCRLVSVCDRSAAALARAGRMCPGVELTSDHWDLVKNPNIDAVAIVTPVWTHFELAKAALEHG